MTNKTSTRLLVALLFAFVVLSGLNYLHYHERTTAIVANAIAAPTPLPDTEPNVGSIHESVDQYDKDLKAYLAARESDSRQLRTEYDHMINHEVVLVSDRGKFIAGVIYRVEVE